MDATRTGAYLAALRKAQGLTQQEAAERLEISDNTVSKWESGGGFPEITVLPALAALYRVTADEILAGESLSQNAALHPQGMELQRRQLLTKLRTRFDVCFILSLALVTTAFFRIPYDVLALILSVTALWIGYVLASHPLRYGGVDGGETIYPNLCRKLWLVSTLQWCVFLRLVRFAPYDPFSADRGVERWKPLALVLGCLVLYAAFFWCLKRLGGREQRLLPLALPRWVIPWLFLGVIFLVLWILVDGAYQEAVIPWLKYPDWSKFEEWDILRTRWEAELRPYLLARRLLLWGGGVGGVSLAAVQLWLRWKKKLRLSRENDKIVETDESV